MFDFHLHSRVSFDGRDTAENMVAAAKKAGLKAICFTDHMDYDPRSVEQTLCFSMDDYRKTYDNLACADLEICRGVEFGFLPGNQDRIRQDAMKHPYDFIIGSLHFADGIDVYFPEYWEGKTYEYAIAHYLDELLRSVREQDTFDVLGHITYLGKASANPRKEPILLKDFQEVADEILKTVAQKGKGIEINTSGVDKCGAFLPDAAYLRRFKELGGSIVTVGSDAHHSNRVGQYCKEACSLVSEIFGYVCTFKNRQPVFHKARVF